MPRVGWWNPLTFWDWLKMPSVGGWQDGWWRSQSCILMDVAAMYWQAFYFTSLYKVWLSIHIVHKAYCKYMFALRSENQETKHTDSLVSLWFWLNLVFSITMLIIVYKAWWKLEHCNTQHRQQSFNGYQWLMPSSALFLESYMDHPHLPWLNTEHRQTTL